jgi:hypothetical protein
MAKAGLLFIESSWAAGVHASVRGPSRTAPPGKSAQWAAILPAAGRLHLARVPNRHGRRARQQASEAGEFQCSVPYPGVCTNPRDLAVDFAGGRSNGVRMDYGSLSKNK